MAFGYKVGDFVVRTGGEDTSNTNLKLGTAAEIVEVDAEGDYRVRLFNGNICIWMAKNCSLSNDRPNNDEESANRVQLALLQSDIQKLTEALEKQQTVIVELLSRIELLEIQTANVSIESTSGVGVGSW